MRTLTRFAAAAALITASATASAWGPFSSLADDFFGNGDGWADGDFNLSMNASANSSAYGRGYGRGHGYNYGSYAPYYTPYAYANPGPVAVAPATEVPVVQ